MKIKLTKTELKECVSNAYKKLLKEDLYGFDIDDEDANDELLRQLLSGDKKGQKALKAAQKDIEIDSTPEIEEPVDDVDMDELEDDEESSSTVVNRQMPRLTKDEIYKMPTKDLKDLLNYYDKKNSIGKLINKELITRDRILHDYQSWQSEGNTDKYVPEYGYKISDEGTVEPSISTW